ncbi:hypothetical protein M2322_002667 [Rhodoblastus acidophilus]|nr:hypothetical protein [Rhodoblastus acidophilus]
MTYTLYPAELFALLGASFFAGFVFANIAFKEAQKKKPRG